MTKLMERAFKKASKLPDDIQNLIAKDLINEIEWETQWNETFNNTQKILDKLSFEALDDYKKGNTEEIEFDIGVHPYYYNEKAKIEVVADAVSENRIRFNINLNKESQD